MVAINIQWDVDYDEVYEVLDEMTCEKASEKLGISKERYANMATGERHDYAYNVFRHSPAMLDDFFDLPDEIEIPEEIVDEEDVSDWLSDEYGFCHRGFELVEA